MRHVHACCEPHLLTERVARGADDGEWVSGKHEGRGVHRGADKSEYDGRWEEGERHGAGTMRFPRGNDYAGEWVAGAMEGRGTMRWPDGNRYEGEWKVGGDMICRTPAPLRGDLALTPRVVTIAQASKKDGIGTFTEPSKAKIGTFRAGACVGEAIQFSADRSKAYRLLDDRKQAQVEMKSAREFAARIGLPVPPPA